MTFRVPGDKSISQRALILAALADGESRIRGLLPSEDPASTAGALRGLGVEIPRLPTDGSELRMRGVGLRGLTAPEHPLDLGNSGTGARLLLGVLAGQPFRSVVTGDESLRSRPMARVADPLGVMGARFDYLERDGRLPVAVGPSAGLRSVDLDLPVASAQVKSALLLAGVVAGVPVLLTEPGASRDHTERMLSGAGAPVLRHAVGPGWRVELRDPPERLEPLDLQVPGDPSSSAFLVLAALLGVGAGELSVAGVGLNPTRTGFIELLQGMGGRIEISSEGEAGGEPVGTLTATRSALRPVEVGRREVVRAVDELPVIAAAAARAAGTTRITGAEELRVKETDRIRALALNLSRLGVRCRELPDGLEIEGTDAPLTGDVESFGDHRIAMVFGVLAAQRGNDIRIVGREAADVSFPGFWHQLEEVSRGG